MVSVLIVEDDREIRELLRDVLEHESYHVRSAGNGLEALQLLTRAEDLPDLILLDWNMPVLNGRGFLLEKKKHAEISRIPVVVISATAPLNLEGAAALVRKPFDIAVLVSALARIVMETART